MLINTIKDWAYTQVDDRVFKHDGCIVDAGCSGWDWCDIFVGRKRVIGIDPYEEGKKGVEFFEGLLGSYNGTALVVPDGATTSGIGYADGKSTKEFPVLNWKTFCKKFAIDRVSILKLNIEGGEYSLLNSMDTEDFKNIDQIVVSFHDFENSKFSQLTNSAISLLKSVGYDVQSIEPKFGWYLAIKDITEEPFVEIHSDPSKIVKNKTTIVTGLWDLGRGNLKSWAKRDFKQYKDRFFDLLQCDASMCIWIPRELEAEVWAVKGRTKENTQIYYKELEDFKTWFPFFDKLQEIRNNPDWRDFADWLKGSPQAALEFYNPMMMCKMFMVNDTAIMNPFNSKYFYWIDGGITNTVGTGYFTGDKVFNKLASYNESVGNKFTCISYPYTANTEIHGFDRVAMDRYCNTEAVGWVVRGGFWGGSREIIHKMNDLYYGVLKNTMDEGKMGADECLFTILAHQYPELVNRFEIEGNGLIWPFFEMLKNFVEPEIVDLVIPRLVDTDVEYIQTAEEIKMNRSGDGTNLYIVTFNSPPQLQLLFDSIEKSNPEILKCNKYLIDNSIDESTKPEYDRIAARYGFKVIRMGNLGVCGARQWAAKHFHESDAKYIVWFEDDMFLVNDDTQLCRNGLRMHVDNWLRKGISIVEKENLDFLKLSFSEFFGEHHKQWAWHNVPGEIREKYFPNNMEPRLRWNVSGCTEGLSYLIGEVYYSNWPSIMTKAGNYKVFLETVYASPFEQVIMSHTFQLSKKGRIRSGVLMASLINHDRVYHYSKEIRKEC